MGKAFKGGNMERLIPKPFSLVSLLFPNKLSYGKERLWGICERLALLTLVAFDTN
jgi:hypothetical protein